MGRASKALVVSYISRWSEIAASETKWKNGKQNSQFGRAISSVGCQKYESVIRFCFVVFTTLVYPDTYSEKSLQFTTWLRLGFIQYNKIMIIPTVVVDVVW